MAGEMGLTDVLDHMDDFTEGKKITLGQIIDSFGDRGYGPLLLAIVLIELLPTGAIPGVPTLVAVLVVLVAGQLLLGRPSPWVPQRLRQKGFSCHQFGTARKKIRPTTRKVDRVIKPRLRQLANPMVSRVIAAVCVLLALTMPPLELIPFASSIPAAAIGLFGIGLAARDGLIVLIASAITVGAGVGVFYWLVL